jgi:hypothetical protein
MHGHDRWAWGLCVSRTHAHTSKSFVRVKNDIRRLRPFDYIPCCGKRMAMIVGPAGCVYHVLSGAVRQYPPITVVMFLPNTPTDAYNPSVLPHVFNVSNILGALPYKALRWRRVFLNILGVLTYKALRWCCEF